MNYYSLDLRSKNFTNTLENIFVTANEDVENIFIPWDLKYQGMFPVILISRIFVSRTPRAFLCHHCMAFEYMNTFYIVVRCSILNYCSGVCLPFFVVMLPIG